MEGESSRVRTPWHVAGDLEGQRVHRQEHHRFGSAYAKALSARLVLRGSCLNSGPACASIHLFDSSNSGRAACTCPVLAVPPVGATGILAKTRGPGPQGIA